MKLIADPVIRTERLILRPVTRDDLPALFELNGDEEVIRYTPHPAWKTAADGEAWFEKVRKNRESGAALQLVMVLAGAGRVVGTMVLFNFDAGPNSAVVGYSLIRELWGKGLTREALKAFADFAFDEMGLDRLEATLDPRNAASAKVLERCGFTREGHQRRNFYAKGEVSDTGLYGLLRGDPR